MGRVIAFSEFADYYAQLRGDARFSKGTILDTNILIALTYDVNINSDEVEEFFQTALLPERKNGFRFFTTVNTRSEYLDFHRRLTMTEYLRDIADGVSPLKAPSQAKAQVQYQLGLLKRRTEQGSDPVLNDKQIKTIKSVFSAGRHSGHSGWLSMCENVLLDKLDKTEQEIQDFGIEYISQHDPHQEALFSKRIDWPDAKRIAEQTCLGLSDAMILNAFQCSRFPFVVSADFDIGYAVLASNALKDVVMPDSVAKKYRSYHFDGASIDS